MIKLGDKVRFINENMEGVVTSLNGNKAGVTIEDDFEIPVLINEIVKINDIIDKPVEEEKPITVKSNFVKIHHGFHIAFDRITEQTLELKFHNSESDLALVAFYQNKQLKQTFTVEIEKNVLIGKFNLQEFNTWPEFTFVITPLNNTYISLQTVNKSLKLNAKEFHGSFKQCYFLGKQAYTFRLDSDIKQLDLKKLKERDFSEPVVAKNQPSYNFKEKAERVVDLHIEQLTSEHKNLSPQAMIDMQMDVVNEALQAAHMHKLKSIIFIHGVGNHYLKNKIKNVLSTHKVLVERYADADMLLYGGGATEVWLR